MPETSLASWRFDDPTNLADGTLSTLNPGPVESWSGYALEMAGPAPALWAVPQFSSQGNTNFSAAAGTFRFWFAPEWDSAGEGGGGPGSEARLLEIGAWSDTTARGAWSLALTPDGNAIRFGPDVNGRISEVLRAPIAWRAGAWHQVALAWSPTGMALCVDGERVAEGVGVALTTPSGAGTPGFCLGSDVYGLNLAQGQFDELVSFGRACSDAEIAWNYCVTAPVAALGPITPEEQSLQRQQATLAAGAAVTPSFPSFWPTEPGHALDAQGGCTAGLGICAEPSTNCATIILTITNADTGRLYDLFRTFDLEGDPAATNSVWRWVGRGTNGQSFTFPNIRCFHAFYALGCDTDSDNDGLTDAFEMLVSKSSPGTNRTYYSTGLDDRDWWLRSNILVNDPEQDCGNEQNSQFETTIAVVGTNVIVAWVDSNQGVYGLGAESYWLTNHTPRLVGYAVSRDGGVTFEDRGVPPVASGGFGDAGDPVLAVDRASGAVYLVGTSPRQSAAHKGVPLWRSADGGVSFSSPVLVHDEILSSDKPWVAVDDWAGTGQHDVYVTCTGHVGSPPQANGVWLVVSRDGQGGSWTNPPVPVRQTDGTNVTAAHSLIVQVGPDHTAYCFWLERTGWGPVTNWLGMRTVQNRGTTLGEVHTICRLSTTNDPNGNLLLKRSKAAEDDTFSAFPFPVPAVNPTKPGHLYLAYADRETNASDQADIFLTRSTDGGTNWTAPFRVNADATTNDQWMPVLAVKPDGTQLLMAWYDRRNDTNNSMIDVFGRWGTIATNGNVAFGGEFKITTTNFPPVFAGTLAGNRNVGHYDPVYPPGVNLHWWYPEWPENPDEVALPTYVHHVGEYNGAWADDQYIYLSWTDYRSQSRDTLYGRNESDVRLIRINWPQ
jgi:hypothetical protein